MSEYIKSHSNYVLRKNHQTISDGTIWERDITTIGGVNQFSPGQIPIYKSNNFIITVRNDGRIANQYNTTNWKSNENGEIWTLESISGMTDNSDGQNDIKIVLKQDYYDFMDFVYYGSLVEMFRSSINSIILRFPGELYGTDKQAYYTDYNNDRRQLGDGYYVSNPFNVNLHSIKKPLDANPLRYFADGGYANYEIIDDESDTPIKIEKWEVVEYHYFERKDSKNFINYTVTPNGTTSVVESTPHPCKGELVAEIRINDNIPISAYIGDNDEIIYTSIDMAGKHIRPLNDFILNFYDECDNFEKILLNPKTTPKYKSTFSVINENEYGYYRKMEEFIVPTSFGDYNIDVTSDAFNALTERLGEIGAYYDELFTDNLYRSMTHEAIKNFDWTYTREFNNGDEEEYVYGGEKIQKALRVFAREFDEIISYIDNIRYSNRITYDGRNNIPDYFLTDEVDKRGWDVRMVYPYDLTEYTFGEHGEKNPYEDGYDSPNIQLSGVTSDGKPFIREFTQDSTKVVVPYSNEMLGEYKNGYFITCCSDYSKDDEFCYYGTKSPYFIKKSEGETTFLDTCGDKSPILKNRIKAYSDEKPYTYTDVNNEFMRRLVINSPFIARHKGTEEGIEMMLSMFGLKSKKWVDSMPSYICDNKKLDYDYEIVEYTSFTNRIEEPWDVVHQMYRIDWINSTKSIVYDNRSISNYTRNGTLDNGTPYEGLPVSYRYEYNNTEGKYIHKESEQKYEDCGVSATTDENNAFKIMETNEPVLRRYLYPRFNKYEQLDGNPYFQMDGGWLSKTIEYGIEKYNFAFDVEDNIAYSEYVPSGSTSEDEVIDNHPIFKETIRNIRRVDSISKLLDIPSSELKANSVVYVTNIEKNVAVINGSVYPINLEYAVEGTLGRYILFTKTSEYILVGDDRFFDDTICVYNKYGQESIYNLSDKSEGYEVKAYITDGDEFICAAGASGTPGASYTIDSFEILDKVLSADDITNYFILDDPYYSDKICTEDSHNGWRPLRKSDPEYIRINTITNYYYGNNPHNGNMSYDNGHEYFTYFKRLFKYAMDEYMFDERCYDNIDNDYDEFGKIGFKNLIDDNEYVKQYDNLLVKDRKIHYFGSYYPNNPNEQPTSCNTVCFYGEDEDKVDKLEKMYRASLNDDEFTVENYILTNEEGKMLGPENPYSQFLTGMTCENGRIIPTDEVTDQIVNNKRMTIRFRLHNKWCSNKGQCELKYIDDIVMNYLTQMIPSTTIVNIEYVERKEDSSHD